MQIRIKLMGMLKDRTPADGVLELSASATILDALAALQIAPESVHVFTVNGQLERNRERELAPDDELSVLPPVGGG
jgi:sulfur carrier protein ThiS